MLTLEEYKNSESIFKCLDKIPKSTVVCIFGSLLNECLLDDNKYNYIIDYDIYLPKYNINLQCPYIWNQIQQEEFIHSLLNEREISPIVVICHEWKKLEIIDGKQRLLTLKRYFNNEFPIHFNNNEYYFKDLDSNLKFRLTRLGVIQGILYYSYDNEPITDKQKIALFNYYNFAGTSQEIFHKNKLMELFYSK